jgi:hypothetical protein
MVFIPEEKKKRGKDGKNGGFLVFLARKMRNAAGRKSDVGLV